MRQTNEGLELAVPSTMRPDDQSFSSDNTLADSGVGFIRNNSGSESSIMATHRNSTGSIPVVRLSVLEPPLKPYSRKSQESISAIRRRPTSSVGSIYDAMSPIERTFLLKRNLTIMFSCIYAVFLTSFGAIVYITEHEPEKRYMSEIFTICTALIGLAWLMFFHVDLFLYKRRVVTKVMQSSEDQIEQMMNSTSTEWEFSNPWESGEYAGNAPYRFLTGRHSGSFYLKAGLAAFCFGHIIYEGLHLGQEILNYVQEDRYDKNCGQASSVAVHLIRPIYSFYQLFIVFKYANIVINKYKELARFALMHIIATCLCFWFSAIVQDALEDHHTHHEEEFQSHSDHKTSNETKPAVYSCSAGAILTDNNVQVIQYLYPFTIEFNLLLVGVWFVVWNNIGKDLPHADPHHFRQKINTEHGIEEVTFQSNLVISADCHASNKGLFAGLFLLMASIISVIVFFVAISTKEYVHVAVTIHSTQETLLTIASLIGSLIAYKQLCKLDFNLHPITFLDDVLLFVPLPFYFIHFTLTMMAEIQAQNVLRIVISLLIAVQVIIQTPFISDGLRRCSNRHCLRYEKPGREIVTFLIVCNLTMWIINTFEENSVEKHHAQLKFFGDLIWMFVKHTTLPLMLFYRFHSSVCLADIWKSAYERGQ